MVSWIALFVLTAANFVLTLLCLKNADKYKTWKSLHTQLSNHHWKMKSDYEDAIKGVRGVLTLEVKKNDRLITENVKLKDELKQYREGVTITNEKLSS